MITLRCYNLAQWALGKKGDILKQIFPGLASNHRFAPEDSAGGSASPAQRLLIYLTAKIHTGHRQVGDLQGGV